MTINLISHQQLSSTQSSISVNNIPQSFDDLYIAFSARTSRTEAIDVGKIAFNNTTGNWSNRQLIGFGTGNGYTEQGSSSFGIFYGVNGNTSTANTFGNSGIYIPNYTRSVSKIVSMDWSFEQNASSGWNGMTAALWNVTSAISSIQLTAEFGSYLQFTTISLYGISDGSNGGVVVT